MKDAKIAEVLQEMLPYLDNSQMEQLQRVLQHTFWNCSVEEKQDGEPSEQTPDMVDLFLASKRVEGCSEKTLTYYKATIEASINEIGKQIRHITTEDLRSYLTEYQRKRHSSRVTIDNIRRILSSFFSWLEDEDYILKSPVRRIHRVKTSTVIKETYTDEALETMRDNCTELRDSVLFSSRAPIGYVAIAANELCTNQGFKSVVPNERTDYLFLYYLLRYYKDAIENLGSGTTFKEVSGSTMRNVKVKVPVLFSEQKKIASVLGAIDDKIEENERINNNLAA